MPASNPDAPAMDEAAAEQLTRDLCRAVKAYFRSQPTGYLTVCEVLNALAATAAVVLAGTDRDPRTIAFFNDALRKNLES